MRITKPLTQIFQRHLVRMGRFAKALARRLMWGPSPLSRHAEEEARRLRKAGEFSAALAIYDSLPDKARHHPKIREMRTQVLDLLRKRVGREARQLRRAGDLIGALAIHDSLPHELREHAEILQQRGDIIEQLRKHVYMEARRLQGAGDSIGALAVHDGLPPELRESADLLPQRARLLYVLGRLDAAAEMARKVLATDPTNRESAKLLGLVLKDLGRADELRARIADMVSPQPPEFEVLVQAAEMAKAGGLAALTDKLLDRVMSVRATANPAAIVRAARILLDSGAQGGVIELLRSETVRSDPSTRSVALELTDRAHAQLREAGRCAAAGPVGPAERADVIAVQSILARDGGLPAAAPALRRHGIAIVVAGLGPNGAQNQTAELVRQICSMSCNTVGPVYLLVLARSRSGPEFYAGKLAGLDVTIEFMSDVEVDAGQSVPADVAAQLNVLSPRIFNQTVRLADRLKAHRPEAVLAMSDGVGLLAMLAASLAGVSRVVVSGRTVPPLERERSDALLGPVYRAALAQNRVALVTNASRTARAFGEWLGKTVSVGTIYNGTDVDELVSQRSPAITAAHRRALGISDSARIVGSIFGARRQKRSRFWIEAVAAIAKRAPDVVFITVGDKLQGDEISATLAEFDLLDRFHRPGIRSDVATWLDLMDVVLLTSEAEGTPNVLLEAQALGRPVVATDVGGTAECFLPGVTGVLLPADPTPEQVADAVLGVLDDPGFAARVREQGPLFIRQRFDPKRMAREYVDLCFPPAPVSAKLVASV